MQDIFVITSVICTSTAAWSYSSERSCFSAEERFQQTLNTISSIRQYAPSAKILLIECSNLNENMTNELITRTDYYIQAYNIPHIYDACHNSDKKGFGEVCKMELALKYIQDNNIHFRRLYKISGRYFLNAHFNTNNYSDEMYTFRMYNGYGSTVLYSVPHSLLDNFAQQILYCRQFYESNPPTGLEVLLPFRCNPLQHLELLGVSGYVAIKGSKSTPDFVSI